MKKILLLVFLMVTCVAANGQWRKVSSGTRANITDMAFVDNLVGYAVGDKTILKTIDGGNKWYVVIKNKTFHNITDILIKGDSVHCYGHHDNGQYYRINFENEGTQFLKKIINYRPFHPQYVDGDIWFVEDQKLKKLTGDTSEVILEEVKDFDVRDGSVSAISKGKILISSDLGTTWQSLSFPSISGTINNCYYDGTDTLHAITQFPTILYSSFDHGRSWRRQQNEGVNSYYFIDRMDMLTISNLPKSTVAYTSLRRNFVVSSTNFNFPLRKCYFKSAKSGFAFGDNGVIYKCSKLPDANVTALLAENTVTNDIYMDEFLFPDEDMFKIESKANENPKDAKKLNFNGLDILCAQLYDFEGKLVKTFRRDEVIDISDIENGFYNLYMDIIPVPNATDAVSCDIHMKYDTFIAKCGFFTQGCKP